MFGCEKLNTLLLLSCIGLMPMASADDPLASGKLVLVASDDFEKDTGQWELLDPESWKFTKHDDRGVLSLHEKKSKYKPPHRSPFHVALLKDKTVGDFELTVSVKSTVKDYPHRDVCLFFGFVDAAHFYYVHIGKKADPHCNQIFIVNDSARKAISLTTTEGTPWNDDWHQVKITRDVESGQVEVFFDDFKSPIMTAKDKTFTEGRVGLGSFDDTAMWDDFQLRSATAAPVVDADSQAKDAKE